MIQQTPQASKISQPFNEKEKRELKLIVKKKAREEKDYPSKKIYQLTLLTIFAITSLILFKYGFFKFLTFITLGYFNHQFSFMIYHSRIHTSFKEKKYMDLHCREYIAWLHHYVEPKYLVCSEHYRAYLHWKFIIFFPIPTTIFLFLCGLGHFTLGVVGSWLFWQTTLAPIHTWYHVKPKCRKRYFSRFEYLWLFTFEKLGIISTKKHFDHHKHDLNNLEEAKDFQDAWMPAFIIKKYNRFFKWFQRLYREGHSNMRNFLKKIILINYLLGHLLFSYTAKFIFIFMN